SSRRRHTRFSRDWSSDVCSSDLVARFANEDVSPLGVVNFFIAPSTLIMPRCGYFAGRLACKPVAILGISNSPPQPRAGLGHALEIGRASCRERVQAWGVRDGREA